MKFPQGCDCDRHRSGRRRAALRAAAPPLLLLLLLLVPRAAAAPLPAADSSGEAELEETAAAAARRAALPGCEQRALLLREQADQLLKEVCEELGICGNSMEMLVRNNLNLPRMTEKDGCLLAGFDEDKCLKKISSGLYMFQIYLEYIRETFTSGKQNVELLCHSTKHLAYTIKQTVINPDEVIIPDSATRESLLTKLRSNTNWMEKVTTHLILRGFTSFMENTVRAIRYLKHTRSFSV